MKSFRQTFTAFEFLIAVNFESTWSAVNHVGIVAKYSPSTKFKNAQNEKAIKSQNYVWTEAHCPNWQLLQVFEIPRPNFLCFRNSSDPISVNLKIITQKSMEVPRRLPATSRVWEGLFCFFGGRLGQLGILLHSD